MNYNDVRKNENKGFSLVELIVVIAIMAVLVAVLAPALLQYVERSRAQKDDSAMGEVANAVMLSLSDQDVYDEVLRYVCRDNISCYIDEDREGEIGTDATKGQILTNNEGTEFMYDDASRMKDEDAWEYAGKMRGMTITFKSAQSANKNIFKLSAGVINEGADANAKYINGGKPDETTLGAMSSVAAGTDHLLYNSVAGIVGETVEITSQTYRNSDYTVFVRMGTTGGKGAIAGSVVVYGQWNGTNLFVGQTGSNDTNA